MFKNNTRKPTCNMVSLIGVCCEAQRSRDGKEKGCGVPEYYDLATYRFCMMVTHV